MRACSNVNAIVLLPEPLNPVNQRVAPCCRSRPWRASRVTWPSCQVMLVALIRVMRQFLLRTRSSSGLSRPCRQSFVVVGFRRDFQGVSRTAQTLLNARPDLRLPFPGCGHHTEIERLDNFAPRGLVDNGEIERIEARGQVLRHLEAVPSGEIVPFAPAEIALVFEDVTHPASFFEVLDIDAAKQMNAVGV